MAGMNRRSFLVCGCALAAGCAGPAGGANESTGPVEADERGEFFAAVAKGDVAGVEAALAETPDWLNRRDALGRAPITVALVHGQEAMAQHLVGVGCVPDVVESAWLADWDGMEAAGLANPERVNVEHPLADSVIHAAVLAGHGRELWRVFSIGGLPNPESTADGFSPLRAALGLADRELAESTAAMLLANGADPNHCEPGGSSALHAAAALGSVDVVHMLIRKRADLDARDARGRTGLAIAEASGHEAVARMLRSHQSIARDHVALRHAFDVDGNPYQPEPLDDVSAIDQHRFVSAAHTDMPAVRSLLAADPRLVHAGSPTAEIAVEAASHRVSPEIIELLLDRGAPLSLPTAAMRGDVGAVARLLDAAPDRVHERGPHDFGLLWFPVLAGGDLDMAQLLLSRGAEVEAQHYLGTTALHFAVLGGDVDMVALLVQHGADIDRLGRKFSPRGHTPLELARERGRSVVVDWLQERDAWARS